MIGPPFFRMVVKTHNCCQFDTLNFPLYHYKVLFRRKEDPNREDRPFPPILRTSLFCRNVLACQYSLYAL